MTTMFYVLILFSEVRSITAFPNIEIVTLGLITDSATSSSHILSAVIDFAVNQFQKLSEASFQLTHTYITDKDSKTCSELATRTEYLLAEWYYNKRAPVDLPVFISPSE